MAITAAQVGEAGYRYTTDGSDLSATSLRAMHPKIRAHLFRQATGIASDELEALYAAAHTDRDACLSWTEIGLFQRAIRARFCYRSNQTALRPDEFLVQGGGDCEHLALLTCGLLRYWGWTCYVGSFLPPGGGNGHAVAMVRRKEEPRGLEHFRIVEGATVEGEAIPSGNYVPIDYEMVGGRSNAMGRDWPLESLHTPEEIYGRSI